MPSAISHSAPPSIVRRPTSAVFGSTALPVGRWLRFVACSSQAAGRSRRSRSLAHAAPRLRPA
eukprot:scaffold32545_cov31-Tisochrysis_lutea.AAC.3